MALVSLDISAAFDSVTHDVLVQQLEDEFGVTGTCGWWISDYITERSFTVWVGQSTSPSRPTTTFAPGNKSSRELSAPGAKVLVIYNFVTFRMLQSSRERKFQRTFACGSESSKDGTFAPGSESSIIRSTGHSIRNFLGNGWTNMSKCLQMMITVLKLLTMLLICGSRESVLPRVTPKIWRLSEILILLPVKVIADGHIVHCTLQTS